MKSKHVRPKVVGIGKASSSPGKCFGMGKPRHGGNPRVACVDRYPPYRGLTFTVEEPAGFYVDRVGSGISVQKLKRGRSLDFPALLDDVGAQSSRRPNL